jgi:hypothetical protein
VSTCVGGWGAGRRPSCLIEEYSATVLSTWIKHSAPLLHSTRMQRVTAAPTVWPHARHNFRLGSRPVSLQVTPPRKKTVGVNRALYNVHMPGFRRGDSPSPLPAPPHAALRRSVKMHSSLALCKTSIP